MRILIKIVLNYRRRSKYCIICLNIWFLNSNYALCISTLYRSNLCPDWGIFRNVFPTNFCSTAVRMWTKSTLKTVAAKGKSRILRPLSRNHFPFPRWFRSYADRSGDRRSQETILKIAQSGHSCLSDLVWEIGSCYSYFYMWNGMEWKECTFAQSRALEREKKNSQVISFYWMNNNNIARALQSNNDIISFTLLGYWLTEKRKTITNPENEILLKSDRRNMRYRHQF